MAWQELLSRTKKGPTPTRGKRYFYGVPWLSKYDRREEDKVYIDAACFLVIARARMIQCNTGFVLCALEERGGAHFGEPCSWWEAAEKRDVQTQ